MSKIVIDSFRGWQANDKNAWQAGAFWNSKNINYRTNTTYVELSRASYNRFSVPNTAIPSAITFWGTWWTVTTDMVVFTWNGVYTSAWQQSVITDIVNVWEANWEKFFLTGNKIYQYTNPSTNTLLATLARTVNTRPTLEFWGDLLIWDWNQLAKWTVTNTLEEYNGTLDLIGNLDGIVVALTRIGQDIYVWCNNGSNTNLYIWDGAWPNWQQKIIYNDKAVQNVALLGNIHYWWQAKSHWGIREILIGESRNPQVFVKSTYTELPLSSNPTDEKNKMAIATVNDGIIWNSSLLRINAIETLSDIVYFPWVGRIFSFWKFFPWDNYSFNTEYTFTGTFVYAMASGWYTWSGIDVSGFLAYCALNGSNYDVNVINLWQDDATIPAVYASSGDLESMEYIATSFAKWEQDVKYTIPFDLPHSSCSIKVYEKRDRATSYTLVKTIDTTEYGTGYNVAEIKAEGRWRTKQFKFELITSNTAYSPKLYVWFTNETLETWKTSSSR